MKKKMCIKTGAIGSYYRIAVLIYNVRVLMGDASQQVFTYFSAMGQPPMRPTIAQYLA